MRPPHLGDLLSTDNSNYGTPVSTSENVEMEEFSYDGKIDPLCNEVALDNSENFIQSI